MNSNKLTPLRTTCVTLLAATYLLSAAHAQMIPMPSTTNTMSSTMPHGQMHKNMTGSDGMKKSMMTGMDSMNKMSMTGDTDKDFAMMMKIHHQQAVDMSEMQLIHGKSPAMKTMARQIIAAQKKEIATFDKWLSTQK